MPSTDSRVSSLSKQSASTAIHEFSADHRTCTCEQVLQFNRPRQNALRNSIIFSLGFCTRLFRNSGLFMYIAFCFKYGGLTFSVAYCTAIAVIGLPTVLLLAAVGQHSRLGPLSCWGFSPAIKGIGLSIMLISALHTAPNMVLASESVYMAIVLLESYGVFGTEKINVSECKSPLFTGFCAIRILPNLSLAECQELGLNVVSPDWGICGEVDPLRRLHASEKSLKNHYLWKRVGIIDAINADDSFAGPKLPTTDLLTGKMRRGFRTDSSIGGNVHWTLLTFVFSLAYCCLLLTLMLKEDTLRTLLHCISMASSASLVLICLISLCWLGDGASFVAGLEEFSSSRRNIHLLNSFSVWTDAVLLAMWNTGVISGELINLTKTNVYGQDFIGSSLLHLSLHCLANTLYVMCQEVIIAYVNQNSKHFQKQLKHTVHGYTHVLMELEPFILYSVGYVLSAAPLLSYAVGEVCDTVSFLCCCVSSVIDVWPGLKRWAWMLHLLLFCMLFGLCVPLCMEFGGAALYNYLLASWGWNSLMLLSVELGAIWHFLGASGVQVLFKHIGLSEQLSRMYFWWQLCWFFYTPCLLLLSMFSLGYGSISFALGIAGTHWNAQISGPLQHISPSKLERSLVPWWIIELIRAVTLLPLAGFAAAYGVSQLCSRRNQRRTKQQGRKCSSRNQRDEVWKELASELQRSGNAPKTE